jgi:ABC-type uncharacterized transport system substrate-binding protein
MRETTDAPLGGYCFGRRSHALTDAAKGDKLDLRKFLRFVNFALLVFSMAMLAKPAFAHPHLWVETHADIVFDAKGHIIGIDVHWTFDDFYSLSALDGLDTNGDGNYSQDELQLLVRDTLDDLRGYDYFVHVLNGEKQVKLKNASNPHADYSNKVLHLHFLVPFAEPIDPSNAKVMLRIYDPDYFIDFEFAKDNPVTIVGGMPRQCRMEIKSVPTTAELQTVLDFLAREGQDQSAGTAQDFGSMFAQPIVIECGN